MVTGAMLTVSAVAGCGADAEPDAETSAQPSDVAVTTAASPTPSPDPAPTTSEASEGSDASGHEPCGDGACEVSFAGSVEFPITGADGEWTVAAAVEENGVMVDLTEPTGMGGGGGLLHHADCTLVVRADGGGSLSCAENGEAPPEPEPGGAVVHLAELNGEDATIKVALG